ncbi:hypothetical protein J2W42_006709 [Rhizobium tibeticum]|uniref:hypothetical protein n=1 Tax=Rhizobium tibeticum TaxID=501024 RepID=UPI0027853612|nr:hypothetical protein [Rhizobium tibeticum]MDP9813833.1 hypothetical protein [Rhizobium tibeticum]
MSAASDVLSMIIAFTAALAADGSSAHDAPSGWSYPLACCKSSAVGGDCEAVPDGRVTKGRRGFRVIIHPGDHHLATHNHLFVIPYGDEMPSGDKDYHIRLHPTERDVNCFFAPPDGV